MPIRWLLPLLILFLHAWPSDARPIPHSRGFVVDDAKILKRSFEHRLAKTLSQVKKATGIELAVLTVPSLEGDSIESFSMNVADNWKLGTKEDDQGLLIILAMKERRIRIEVGQGLEGDLTDAESRRIIDEVMVPLMRTEDYQTAVYLGVYQALAQASPDTDLRGFFEGASPRRGLSKRGSKKFSWIVLLFWIIIIFFGGRSGLLPLLLLGGVGRGHYRGGGFGGGGFGGGFGGGGGGGFSGGGASGGW